MTPAAKVGWPVCTALVVANMVGTGIFTSLGFQLAEIPSTPAILLLWLLGGTLALCGALCYAELSAALPRSGGEYHFIGQIYHPALGFMAGAVSLVVGFAAPVALSAMAFGSYLQGVFPAISARTASVVVVLTIMLFHLRNLKVSSIFQLFFTMLKIGVVVFLIGALLGGPSTLPSSTPSWGHYVFSAPFAVALMFTLYTYSGWNAATYILDEVRRPSRDVPIALILGTTFVMLLYLLLNYAFLRAAPAEQMAGQINVAQIAASAAFGDAAGKVVAGIIALGLVSAVSAMIWAGARVALVLGEDYPRTFHWLRWRNASGMPVGAVLFQNALTLTLIATSTFEQILIYTQFALLVCSFMTVAGLMILRHTRPDLPRVFRTPWYPLPPILFLSISGFALVYTATIKPWEALCGALTLLLALFAYRIISPRNATPST